MNQPEDWNVPEEHDDTEFAEADLSAFEADLTRALRRVDAPAGFADRVIARSRTSQKPAARVLLMKPRHQQWLGAAIAAVLLMGVFGAEQLQQRQQRERAAAAQQQFEAGIRITDDALDHVRDQLQNAGVGVGK